MQKPSLRDFQLAPVDAEARARVEAYRRDMAALEEFLAERVAEDDRQEAIANRIAIAFLIALLCGITWAAWRIYS